MIGAIPAGKGLSTLQSWIARVSLTRYGMTLQDFSYFVAHWRTGVWVHWHLGALVWFSCDMTVWMVEGGERLHFSSYRHTYLLTTHVTQICWGIDDSICESLLSSPFNHFSETQSPLNLSEGKRLISFYVLGILYTERLVFLKTCRNIH